MGLGPPVCIKCLIIGHNGEWLWYCPKCHSTNLKHNLAEFMPELQKIIGCRSDIIDSNEKTKLLEKNLNIVHVSIRPFMLDNLDPNARYRLWLEENVGKQGNDWSWDISDIDVECIIINFINKESALLFELTWP